MLAAAIPRASVQPRDCVTFDVSDVLDTGRFLSIQRFGTSLSAGLPNKYRDTWTELVDLAHRVRIPRSTGEHVLHEVAGDLAGLERLVRHGRPSAVRVGAGARVVARVPGLTTPAGHVEGGEVEDREALLRACVLEGAVRHDEEVHHARARVAALERPPVRIRGVVEVVVGADVVLARVVVDVPAVADGGRDSVTDDAGREPRRLDHALPGVLLAVRLGRDPVLVGARAGSRSREPPRAARVLVVGVPRIASRSGTSGSRDPGRPRRARPVE